MIPTSSYDIMKIELATSMNFSIGKYGKIYFYSQVFLANCPFGLKKLA